jgi:hypothetical protein
LDVSRQRTKGVAGQGAPALLCRAMFANLFHDLKAAGVPVTLREYLTLMQAMDIWGIGGEHD